MKNVKTSLILVLLAYPLACLVAVVFNLLCNFLKSFIATAFSGNTALIISQLIPSVGFDASVLALVLCINVFSVLLWCAKKNSADKCD